MKRPIPHLRANTYPDTKTISYAFSNGWVAEDQQKRPFCSTFHVGMHLFTIVEHSCIHYSLLFHKENRQKFPKSVDLNCHWHRPI